MVFLKKIARGRSLFMCKWMMCFDVNRLAASQNFTFLLYFRLLCSIRMVLYMYYKTKAAYVSRWLPEMDMDRMGSVKLVSKSRNNFPFLV